MLRLILPTSRKQVYRPIQPYNNELSNWVLVSRQAQRGLHEKDLDIAIKGDKKELYPVMSEIIGILEKQKKFKFDLITDLKTVAKK